MAFADADDIGIARLVERLRRKTSVVWWKFGAPATSVYADVNLKSIRLEQPGVVVTSADFDRAKVIIYRRRFHFPRPLVASSLDDESDRLFSEREWSSLIDGILLREEQRSGAVWVNSPSSSLRCTNKLALLLRAGDQGLPMAQFRVSTPVRVPPHAPRGLVTKAISVDERIDSSRYLTTALVSPAILRDIKGAHLGTPCLLQHRIQVKSELRIIQILGETIAVLLKPSARHVDIRYISAQEMEPRLTAIPPELSSPLAAFMASQQLHFCTFDVLIDSDGSPYLVDITPNGSWDYFEDDEAAIISDAVAKVVTKNLVA